LIALVLLILPFSAAHADFGEGPPGWLPDYDYRVWISGEYLSLEVPPLEKYDGLWGACLSAGRVPHV
jgi:hypothetical protein